MTDSRFRWENAYVADEKILDYLLSLDHAEGSGKAKFFLSVGYARRDWTRLRDDLLLIARTGDVADVIRSAYGVKTVIDGMVRAPSGATISLRTIWIDETLDDVQRLVTAYPR